MHVWGCFLSLEKPGGFAKQVIVGWEGDFKEPWEINAISLQARDKIRFSGRTKATMRSCGGRGGAEKAELMSLWRNSIYHVVEHLNDFPNWFLTSHFPSWFLMSCLSVPRTSCLYCIPTHSATLSKLSLKKSITGNWNTFCSFLCPPCFLLVLGFSQNFKIIFLFCVCWGFCLYVYSCTMFVGWISQRPKESLRSGTVVSCPVGAGDWTLVLRKSSTSTDQHPYAITFFPMQAVEVNREIQFIGWIESDC